jgi:hypothetical protein
MYFLCLMRVYDLVSYFIAWTSLSITFCGSLCYSQNFDERLSHGYKLCPSLWVM